MIMKVVAVMRTLALTVIVVYLQSFQSGTISKCCRQRLSLAVSTASCTYLATDPLFRVLTAEVLLSIRAGIVFAWWVYHWDVLLLFMEGRKRQKPERTGRQYSWLAFQSPGSEKNRGWSRNLALHFSPDHCQCSSFRDSSFPTCLMMETLKLLYRDFYEF